jgi:hypothetical protein
VKQVANLIERFATVGSSASHDSSLRSPKPGSGTDFDRRIPVDPSQDVFAWL